MMRFQESALLALPRSMRAWNSPEVIPQRPILRGNLQRSFLRGRSSEVVRGAKPLELVSQVFFNSPLITFLLLKTDESWVLLRVLILARSSFIAVSEGFFFWGTGGQLWADQRASRGVRKSLGKRRTRCTVPASHGQRGHQRATANRLIG